MAKKIKSANQLYFTKDHDMVRRAVKEFVDKEINPNLDEWEAQGIAPLHDLFKKMGDLGFLGIRYDPKYGGQGLDYWYDLILLEEMGHCHGMGIPMAVSVQTLGASEQAQAGHRRYRTRGRIRRCRAANDCQKGRRLVCHQRLQNIHHQRYPGRLFNPSGPNQ